MNDHNSWSSNFGRPFIRRAMQQGQFTVWVLNGAGGNIEYIIGHNEVPPDNRLHQVIAKIGPIAWEGGQGLDGVLREQLANGIKQWEVTQQRGADDARMREMIRREMQAAFPPPDSVNHCVEAMDQLAKSSGCATTGGGTMGLTPEKP